MGLGILPVLLAVGLVAQVAGPVGAAAIQARTAKKLAKGEEKAEEATLAHERRLAEARARAAALAAGETAAARRTASILERRLALIAAGTVLAIGVGIWAWRRRAARGRARTRPALQGVRLG